MRRRPSPLSTYLAVGVVALALLVGCGDGEDAASTTTEPEPTSTTDQPTTTTTTAPDDDVMGDTVGCTSPDGYTVEHPTAWDAVSDCGQFGPAPVDEPAPATDERPGVVSGYVEAVAYSDVAATSAGDQAVTVVEARQATRVDLVTGEDSPLYPPGTRIVRWMVDLSLGVDDGDGTLFFDAVDVREDVDFDRAVRVLDAMVRTLEIEAGDQPQGDGVIARYEGGGAPVTVAVAPSATQPSTCFRVVGAESSVSCVRPLDRDPASFVALDAPGGPVTAGIARPDVWSVEVVTDGSSVTYLPVGYPGRDTTAFAVPVDPDAVTSVVVRDRAGAVQAELDPASIRRPVS